MSGQTDLLLSRAQAAVLARDFSLAARLYRLILKEEPDNLKVMSELASTYVRANEDEKALMTYSAIIRKDPRNFDALNSLGGIYRRLGKYTESIDVLKTALSIGGNENLIFYNMGHTYKLMGNYAEAADCFISVVEENPNDVLAYNHLGSIQALQGHHEKALLSYARALQLDPNHPILHYNSAASYEALGKYQEAKTAYEAALRSKPGWAEAMNGYASLLVKMKKIDDAQEVLEKAVVFNPEDTAVHTALGTIYYTKGLYDKAENTFSSVLGKEEDNLPAMKGLEEVYEKLGRFPKAAELLAHMEKNSSSDHEFLLHYAEVLMEINKLYEAGIRIKKVRDEDPVNTNALNALAQYFVRKGQKGKARGCYKRISDIDPTNITYLRDVGKVLSKIGDFADAEEHLKLYIKKRPEDILAWTALASNYEASGMYPEAIESYEKTLDIEPRNPAILESLARIAQKLPNDSESLKAISDIVGKNSPEKSLEALEQDIKFREETFSNVAEMPEGFGLDVSIDDDAEIVPELDLGSDIEDAEELDFDNLLQLDIKTEDEDDIFKDDFDPLILEMAEEKKEEDDDDISLNSLLQDDSPLDYQPSQEKEDYFDPFAGQNAKKYDPIEEQEYMGIDGYSFEDDDLEEENREIASSIAPEQGQPLPQNPPPVPPQPSPLPPEPEPLPEPEAPVMPPPLPPKPKPEPEPELPVDTPFEPLPKLEPDPVFDQPDPIEDILPTEDPIDDLLDTDLEKEDLEEDLDLSEILENPEEWKDSEEIDDSENLEEGESSEEPSFDDIFGIGDSEEEDEENNLLEQDLELEPEAELEPDLEMVPDLELESDAELEPENSENKTLEFEPEVMQKVKKIVSDVLSRFPVTPFSSTAEMFSSLRDLCTYLPAGKKEEFLISLDRLRLDYVIDRLQGRPGLLAAAQALRTNGIVSPKQPSNEDQEKALSNTLGYMRDLAKNLPDNFQAEALEKKIDTIIQEL